jgi:hypothetical protein
VSKERVMRWKFWVPMGQCTEYSLLPIMLGAVVYMWEKRTLPQV